MTINNSKKTYPFILDSGAKNILFEKKSSSFELEKNGFNIGMGSNGNFFTSGILKVNKLQIGDLVFKKTHMQLVDFEAECLNAYGLIGNGIMRHLVWQIDFDKKIIIISDEIEDQNIDDNSKHFKLSENPFGHQLSIPLQLNNGESIKATIDLGSNGNLSLDEKYLLKDSLKLEFKQVYGYGPSGLGDSEDEEFKERIYLVDSLNFVGSDYKIIEFPVHAGPESLNLLGLGFFTKYKTTISWKDKKLIITPYDSIQNFKWRTSGFGTMFKDEVTINAIFQNSSSSNLDIDLKDKVVSINGFKPLNESEYCQMKKYLRKKDTLLLELENKRKIIEVIKKPIFQ